MPMTETEVLDKLREAVRRAGRPERFCATLRRDAIQYQSDAYWQGFTNTSYLASDWCRATSCVSARYATIRGV
jgi:hypothetical protein